MNSYKCHPRVLPGLRLCTHPLQHQDGRRPQDFFLGPFCAETNTVFRQRDALHPSHPLCIKSSWLKPAGLRLDWLRITVDHPYLLESYPPEKKKIYSSCRVSKQRGQGLEVANLDLPGQADSGAYFSFSNQMAQFCSHFRSTDQQASLQIYLTLWKNIYSFCFLNF